MATWQEVLKQSVTTVDDLIDAFGAENIDRAAVEQAMDGFQMRITPAVLTQIRRRGDAAWRQYVPSGEELTVHDGMCDPLSEDYDSPIANITHRYPDRVLLLVSPVCASYCRFCTRRRKVGDPEQIPTRDLEPAFTYIREHPEIRDVVLSGGDPLMLSDRRLNDILGRLRQIPHVEILRIHTRIASHLPERITPELCEVIRQHHPLFINVHVNHPDELTPATTHALGMLADAGAPLGSHTVILRGVNDDPVIMRELFQKLLRARVRPYYLFMADPVAGGEHFRTSLDVAFDIIRHVRGWTSGLAVPHLAIDAPGGGGKVPVLPTYLEAVTESTVELRNYAGELYTYPLPVVPAGAGP